MKENLFKLIDLKIDKAFVPYGRAKNLIEYGMEYDKMILDKGGIDLQVLGIGSNGHIAFNEPSESLSLWTTVVELTDQTIKDNSRFFDDIKSVPTKAITMGIGSIMKAKKIILPVNGENKADILAKIINKDSINANIPASILFLHQDFTIICDKKAYSKVDS